MIDFAAARRMMVDGQVRPSDVTDLRLIAAMLELPRERFVPAASAELAYSDSDLAVGTSGGAARRLLLPRVLAKLLQAADVGLDDRVLVVGCGTGYSAAVLARLAGAVVALEQDAVLAKAAGENLVAVGAVNARVVVGTLSAGWGKDAPYDVILFDGACEVLPASIGAQLADGGRLVGIFGRAPGGRAMLYRLDAGDLSGRHIFDAAASVLPGFAAEPAFVF
jgi:protein-L-isoaspartate(D-aspartate) O-methyltransferase